MNPLIETTKWIKTQITHHLQQVPVVVLMPHSACNCRCVMCDIWKANAAKREISADDLSQHLDAFRHLGVRWVVLSGGEALMHPNLWTLCELLKSLHIKITLLSTGLLLRRYSENIVRWCDEVIVSLDGSREVHDRIRNIPRAYDRLAEGVTVLKSKNPSLRITARCVIQHGNYFDLPNIIDAAHEIGLDQISFMAVDVSTTAFNRPVPWENERIAEVALNLIEVMEFERILEQTFIRYREDFNTGFIAESPEKLRRLHQYFAALNGTGDFPEIVCNAPWVSTVIEADGTVRPCFFHQTLGNIYEQSLDAILNSEEAITFRRQLDVKTDPICRKCVCTLYLDQGVPTAVVENTK